jgi:hypothetical protein
MDYEAIFAEAYAAFLRGGKTYKDGVSNAAAILRAHFLPQPEPGQDAKERGEDSPGFEQTTDAAKWARAFVYRFGGDEDNMRGWFANAIEHGRDAGLAASRPADALGGHCCATCGRTLTGEAADCTKPDDGDCVYPRFVAWVSRRESRPADALLDRLRHLTPGGSEFQTADECFAWIEARLANRFKYPADAALREASRVPCEWCANSSYNKPGSNIMQEPCFTCVDAKDWPSFKFAALASSPREDDKEGAK